VPMVSAGLPVDVGYTGHEWDAGAKLHYAPYRFYIGLTMRWLSRDPLGLVAGPNQYSYVSLNPTSRTDQLGLIDGECAAAITALTGVAGALAPPLTIAVLHSAALLYAPALLAMPGSSALAAAAVAVVTNAVLAVGVIAMVQLCDDGCDRVNWNGKFG
jgi:RHS repeat-associated protein